MNDRLAELKKLGKETATSETTLLVEKTQGVVPDFMKKVQNAQTKMDLMKQNNKRMISLKEEHRHATTTGKEKEISQELNGVIEANLQNQGDIKVILDELDQDVMLAKKEDPERVRSFGRGNYLVQGKST